MTDDPRRDDAADDSAPSAERASPVSAVGALMEERRRYEAWLAALEARRAETPKHVFTRVHADYTSRLESVIERLVGHTDGLRAELTTLTTRIASLDEQQHRARDERAEAELRAHVGELTENGWKEMLAASDALIASLAAQHAAAEEDLRRTRELLADAERPPTPVPPPAQVTAAPPKASTTAETAAPAPDSALGGAHVPAAEPARTEQSAPANGRPPGETKPGDASFDELAFLQSVVDVANGGPSAAPAEPPPRPAPAPVRPTGSAAAAPPPAAPQRREPFTARKPEPRPEDRIQKQGEATAPLIRPKQGGSSLAANISGNNPIILKDKPTESAKTLKCAECGAMNYPTEWYCERCGAELASL